MAIDASIYSQIQQPQLQDPLNALAKVSQVKAMQNQNQLAQLTLADKQRETAGDNALAGLLAGGGDSAAVAKGLAEQGYGAKSLAYTKQAAELAKQQRDAEKAKIEQGLAHFAAIGQIMGGVKDQATYDQARQQAAQLFGPEAAANLPPVYDPATIAQNQQQALSVKDQLEQRWKALNADLDERKFGYQQQNDTANRNVTLRGQNMTDARAREANTSGKIPSGYRANPDGSLSPIPGGPADVKAGAGGKPLTDSQSKAALFGSRMQASDQIIADLAAQGINKSVPGSTAPIIGGIVTAVSPAKRQQLDQAKRDFINATLRRESGAVISPEEFNNGEKQYFPQPGDSAEVIKQKANNRAIATRGILAEVPEGRRDALVSEIIGNPAGGKVIDFGSLK